MRQVLRVKTVQGYLLHHSVYAFGNALVSSMRI
jgi:hypothetical protein